MARLIGDAYVVIYPQADAFGPQTEALVKQQLSAVRPTVNVRPQLDKTAAAAMKAQLDAVGGDAAVGARISPAQLAALRDKINAVLKNISTDVKPTLDRGAQARVDAQIFEMTGRANILRAELDNLRANVDGTAATAAIAALTVKTTALAKALEAAGKSGAADLEPLEARLLAIQASFEKIRGQNVSLNDAPALAALTNMADRAGRVRVELQGFRASIDDTAAEAKLAALEAQAAKLSRALTFAPADADLAPFEAQLLGIYAAYEKIRASQQADDTETEKQVTFWNRLGLAGAGSLTNLREVVNAATAAGRGIRLFGGAIDALYQRITGNELPNFVSHLIAVATPVHLATEAVVEFVAIWAPALITLTAYAAAATPTVIMLGKQLQNMNTAATGTGKAFDSLTTKSGNLVAAVRPSVLEAFGIGLYAIQNKASNLGDVLHQLGAGIDQFAAKAAIAFDSNTSSKFFQQGAKDVLALMDSFQQLGSILGTLFKVVPGYAEVLLGVGNAALGMAANVTKAIEPILAEFLRLHGALLYGGLTGTAGAWVFGKIVSGATIAVEAVAGLATRFLAADSLIVESLGKVLIGLDALGSTPVLLGIGLVIGAITAIAIYMKASSNAASEFNKTVQSALSNTAVTSLPQALATDIAQANQKIAASQQNLNQVMQAQHSTSQTTITDAGKVNSVVREMSPAMASATGAVATYTQGQMQLSQQQKNLNLNLGAIAATFGTTIPGALSLASAAQVTSNQLLAKGGNNWAVISTMIAGYITQLKVLVPGTGALNQALNALSVTQSQQVQDAQKVTQAYQGWIGIVTGGDSAFTTFEQGQKTLADTLNKATAGQVKMTDSAGKLKEQISLVGASMNGTSDASLAARQAFDSQVTAAVQLYGSLQTMSVVSGSTAKSQDQLAQAGKDLVAQLAPLAAGSKSATAEVFALAQIAGYQGTDSLKSLTQWSGNAKGAEADLNKQTQELTVSSANLTQAAKDLSAAMANEVAAGETAAIAKTTNLKALQDQLASSIINANGTVDAASTKLAGEYYQALIQAGNSSNTARDDVDAFLAKMGATPGVVSQVNASLNSLPKTVSITVRADNSQAISAVDQAKAALASANGQVATMYVNIVESGQTFTISAGGLNSPHFQGGIVGAAKGMVVPGTSTSVTRDNHLIAVKSGELIIPSQHAPKFRDMARRASIPGFAGGGVPEPAFGLSSYSQMPYSYAYSAPAAPNATAEGTGSGLPAATSYGQADTNRLLAQVVKLLQQLPYSQAQAISQANATGVRRGFFATAG